MHPDTTRLTPSAGGCQAPPSGLPQAEPPNQPLRFRAASVHLDLGGELLGCLRHLRDAIRDAGRYAPNHGLPAEWGTIKGDARHALSLAEDLERQQRL